MILESLTIEREAFERATGWEIKPEGACKAERCVPLGAVALGRSFDVRLLAERLGMPLVHDARHGLWSLGPEAGGRALTSVDAPEVSLPDVRGDIFRLSSLRGQKVLLVAWASW
jgi:hypothetical protein